MAITITRESFTQILVKKASAGDIAALKVLTNEKAQALGFAELLLSAATAGKITLSAILADTDPEAIDWALKQLPKDSPQRASIVDARKSTSSAPRLEHFAAGAYGYKDGSKNPAPMLRVSLKGATRFSENHQHQWWGAFLALIDSPEAIATIRAFVASPDTTPTAATQATTDK